MKKKLAALLIAGTMIMSPIAVYADEKDDRIAELEAQVAEMQATIDDLNAKIEELTASESKNDETTQEDIGAGEMYISTPGGTSENGNIPVIYVGDEILMEIGINAFNFDGSKLSYVYIDGTQVSKEQYTDTQSYLNLSEDNLAVGTHKIEVIQYDNDDPKGTVVTHKTAEYEIKSK